MPRRSGPNIGPDVSPNISRWFIMLHLFPILKDTLASRRDGWGRAFRVCLWHCPLLCPPPRVRNRRVYLAYTQICQTPQIFRYFRNFFLWLLSEIVNTDEMEYQSQGVQGHENAFFFGSQYVGRRGEVSPQPPTPGPEGHLMSSPAPPLAPSQAAARTWGWSWASRWAFRSARCCWRPSRAAPTAAQGIS